MNVVSKIIYAFPAGGREQKPSQSLFSMSDQQYKPVTLLRYTKASASPMEEVGFYYLEETSSLSPLLTDYDVIWCQDSLIDAPANVIRAEAQELLQHLPVEERWIQLAYPKPRWEREGKLPFDAWGQLTDGPGVPWVEWYDLTKLKARLEPAHLDAAFYPEFHNSDFNWFDLVRRS